MIDIGQKMRFVPYWNIGGIDTPEEIQQKTITGKVIYVDRDHKKFTVKYSVCGGNEQKETFKFSQIGQDIHIVGGVQNGQKSTC